MFTDVMVDTETTGLRADRNGLLQIAAVKFNLATGEIDAANMFDQCLVLPPWRSWDEGTRIWWSNQKRETFENIIERARPADEVMREFCAWAYPVSTLRMWAKPIHFDYNFINSYCHDYGLVMPFSHRTAMDMKPFIEGLYFPAEPNYVVPEFTGAVHNALDDSIHQLETLFAAVAQSPKSHLLEPEILPPSAPVPELTVVVPLEDMR